MMLSLKLSKLGKKSTTDASAARSDGSTLSMDSRKPKKQSFIIKRSQTDTPGRGSDHVRGAVGGAASASLTRDLDDSDSGTISTLFPSQRDDESLADQSIPELSQAASSQSLTPRRRVSEPKIQENQGRHTASGGAVRVDRECPPYREEIGRSTWTLLHSIASYIPDGMSKNKQTQLKHFMHCLSLFYPCKECAKEFRAILREDPPLTKTREEFSQWMCRVHNKVNKRLGKPTYDCSKINERWKDGWKDGSCD